MDAFADQFASHPLLGLMSPEERRSLLHTAQPRVVYHGKVLLLKGASATTAFIIRSGFLKATSGLPDGRKMILAILGPGELIGELGIIDGDTRSADVTAMTDSILLEMDGRILREILTHRGDICLHLLKVLSKRLRRTNQQMERNLLTPAHSRLARAVLEISSAAATSRGNSAEPKLSQQDLANLLGLSRESVNKILKGWRDLGLIALSRGRITIVDRAKIEALSFE